MRYHVTPLTPDSPVLMGLPLEMTRAYFSPGSVAYCLWDNNEPVFAGGVVNLLWDRGEAWILPNSWFKANWRACYRVLRGMLGVAATEGRFKRIQATCATTVSALLFQHLGFAYEGTMQHFGPNGEDCLMYARITK